MAASRKKGAEESLTSALARLLENTLLPDLTARAKTPAVAAVLGEQHAREHAAARTADTLAEWTPRWLEQIGAAWVLSCVFLRTLEERGLVRHHRIAGEGAADAEQLFFELAPSLTARDYLLTAFREVARHPGAADLLGPAQNPAFRLSPSNEGARALLDFFRQPDESGEGLRWRFEGSDTRFLGDLYQDLSASVRERYALLQTPVFVEEFILDLTLEPAIRTFGLEETHVIDPTCGSGHFLLGAFDRICEHRMRKAPGLDAKEHALAALAQVHGVDLNPYAAAIARFRLTLAYLAKAGLASLTEVPKRLPIEVVVADALLHGVPGMTRRFSELEGQSTAAWGQSIFELEDKEAADRVFGRKYQAVVGNPPYILPKDNARRDEYRRHYRSCYRGYALSAPFVERFFQIAIDGGYIGMINANSFMKREFGKKLIEDVLSHLDITRVIDTSGAYIPGHGTPTVLLFGRHQPPMSASIRSVLGKRGEPKTPTDPANGLVWSSIATHFDDVTYDDQFVSVADLSRSKLVKHPWSFGGGGTTELKARLEERGRSTLGEKISAIGRTTVCGEDDAWLISVSNCMRITGTSLTVPLVVGESVRDWSISGEPDAIYPYDRIGGNDISAQHPVVTKHLWLYKSILRTRTVFSKTLDEKGSCWFSHLEHYTNKLRTSLSIAFAFVATHNHFVLDRGGKVFNRTAPVIKLPEGATEEDHLALLGYLNSSTACFWMKQVFHKKSSASQKHHTDPARAAYEFAATALFELPIPALDNAAIISMCRIADQLGHERGRWLAGTTVKQYLAAQARSASELKRKLVNGWQEYEHTKRRSIYVQEEIDWFIYACFGLYNSDTAGAAFDANGSAPLGSRPFEWATGYDPGISRRALEAVAERDRDQEDSSEAIPLPAAWAHRAELLKDSELRIIESTEFKRQWRDTEQNIDQRQFRGLAEVAWIEEHVDDWLECQLRPIRIQTARTLSALAAQDPSSNASACAEYLGRDLPDWLRVRLLDQAVPYLAALRYTPEGLEIRAQWERTWALQRLEDAGEELTEPIPVPPKYDAKDFRDPVCWRLRGKLDVPKERFISYPGAEKDDDPSPLFGWAGWNHLERATALAGLYQERKTEDGWGAGRLTPLLAGLLELVPWLKQWHNEMNEEFGERLGDYYERYVDTETRALGLTLDALRAWRPEAKRRKPRAKKGAP